MQEIVDKYDTSQSDYLLPIIIPQNPIEERKQYIYMAHNINRSLKIIGQRLGLSFPFTMYVSRHSWASIAKNKNIPLIYLNYFMLINLLNKFVPKFINSNNSKYKIYFYE